MSAEVERVCRNKTRSDRHRIPIVASLHRILLHPPSNFRIGSFYSQHNNVVNWDDDTEPSFFLLLKGFGTTKDIQTQYRNIASFALNEGASNFPEILAVDKVPRHLLNLVANGNIRQVKKYAVFITLYIFLHKIKFIISYGDSNEVTSYIVIDVAPLVSKLGKQSYKFITNLSTH